MAAGDDVWDGILDTDPPGACTAIVEVAIDHLNRIVTPFRSPQVRTVSPATTGFRKETSAPPSTTLGWLTASMAA